MLRLKTLTREMLTMNDELESLCQTVAQLEKACLAMYELILDHNQRLTLLEKEIASFEDESC